MGSVSLQQALEAAWQRAVAARESEGLRRRAEADRLVAESTWARPPALALQQRDERLQGRSGSREVDLGLALPLWLPGQRAARAGAAQAWSQQAQAAERVARLRLAGDLREAAWALAAQQADMALAQAQVLALRRLADDVQRRVAAGDLARADSLAAQAEHLAATAELTDARRRLQAARARWTLLTGLDALPSLQPDSAAPGPQPDSPVPGQPADAAAHPELQLAQEASALAQQRLDLVRHSRRDAPELTLGVRQQLPGRGEPAQGSLAVGLRLPFGTEARNRPLEAAALAELDIALTQVDRLRERLDSEIATARDAQRAAQEQLAAETTRARLLRERALLIDTSFRAGETPLPDLLRALAAAAQADSAVARQTAALGLAQARLQQALGRMP